MDEAENVKKRGRNVQTFPSREVNNPSQKTKCLGRLESIDKVRGGGQVNDRGAKWFGSGPTETVGCREDDSGKQDIGRTMWNRSGV